MLDAERSRALEKPVHGGAIELAGAAAEAVRLRESCQQLQIDFVREPAECAVSDLVAHLEPHAGFEMLRDHAEHLMPDVVAIDRVNVQSIEKGRGRRDT